LGSAHAVTPAPAATIDQLGTALDNLALAAANNTTVLQELMASILASSLVATLTVANKKLAEALARAKPTSPPAATLGAPKPVRSTNTPFPGNYCWTHGHQCSQHHTRATCGNKIAGHKNNATAANTMGGSKANKGWNTCTWRCGMANIVYCNNSDLCKTNYYYALATEFVPNPLPTLPSHHTGIAYSGSNGHYFAPNAPVDNYNPQALTIGVHVANGRPKRLVASATLASATALPPAALSGHVMLNFPHTLIGLGPFANQDCMIVFTQTAVTVYHPDGHPILSGWQDDTGPRLWHFPLTANAANPQEVTGATAPRPLIPAPSLLPAPAPSVTRLPPPFPMVIPLAVSTALHPHPSQGILATDTSMIACLVYYLYGAAQAVALAAHAAGTPFNPRSLNLLSIGALVGFYHACLGFTVKQTWLDAIKAGNCDNFKGLTYSNVANYCLDADETIMGHLSQQGQNVRSTKAKPTLLVPLAVLPTPVETPSNQVFVITKLLSKLFTYDTGHFPVRACSGNQYVMIAFQANCNLILTKPSNTSAIATALQLITPL
jgi:hypothetical protein